MKIKVLKVFASVALGLVLGSHAYAQFGNEPAELELVKVRDDIYVISNPYVPGLTTALITNDGVLLVDDKYAIDHDNIMAMLRSVTDQPVKYVVNTHHHNDHSGGNEKLQMEDVIAVASDQARQRMIDGKSPGLLVRQGKSRADIEAVVRSQFEWEDFHVQMALDGLIDEFR